MATCLRRHVVLKPLCQSRRSSIQFHAAYLNVVKRRLLAESHHRPEQTYLMVYAILQAQARCHRIGQSKAVKIYRLITRNSYEREMFDKASLKLGLDKAVLQSMSGRENANSGVQQLSKKEIEDLLRKGAYGALMDEEDEGSKFCEEDIDQILQRRTHTITIESEGKGSTFAKVAGLFMLLSAHLITHRGDNMLTFLSAG